MNHFSDKKLYYANECGFFSGLGLRVLLDYTSKPIEFRYNCDAPWYFKMAGHYGRLALRELERKNDTD